MFNFELVELDSREIVASGVVETRRDASRIARSFPMWKAGMLVLSIWPVVDESMGE
jgi:hypothetical protein